VNLQVYGDRLRIEDGVSKSGRYGQQGDHVCLLEYAGCLIRICAVPGGSRWRRAALLSVHRLAPGPSSSTTNTGMRGSSGWKLPILPKANADYRGEYDRQHEEEDQLGAAGEFDFDIIPGNSKNFSHKIPEANSTKYTNEERR
jgi:hypothetical protein